MYPINLTTCTARDVIQRSVTCHPSLFSEALRDLASVHGTYAGQTSDALAAQSARNLQRACQQAAHHIEHDADANAPELICDDFNMRIVAFTEACRLQCIPYSSRIAIIERV